MWGRETQSYFSFLKPPTLMQGFGYDPVGSFGSGNAKWGVLIWVCVHACVASMNQPLGLGGFIMLGEEQARLTLCVLLGHLAGNRRCPQAWRNRPISAVEHVGVGVAFSKALLILRFPPRFCEPPCISFWNLFPPEAIYLCSSETAK